MGFNSECGIYLKAPTVLLTLGAILSLTCYAVIFLLYYYYRIPYLRRHPTSMTIHKVWFEIVFVSQFLLIPYVPKSFFYSFVSTDSNLCVTNPHIWPLAWLTQFTLLGGELWFGVLSLDIQISLTNPFTSYLTNKMYYTLGVYSFSFVCATLLVSLRPLQYGLSYDPMIWVTTSTMEARWTKFWIFYLWMVIIYVYSVGMVLWARSQIYKGLEETLASRKYQVSKQTRYVIGYCCFWTAVFFLQFLIYLSSEGITSFSMTDYQADVVRSSSAFLLASRGIWSLAIFLAANYAEITEFFAQLEPDSSANGRGSATSVGRSTIASTLERDSRGPVSGRPKAESEQLQLNIALQKEIVRFTVLGIQKSIKDYAECEEGRLSDPAVNTFFNKKPTGETFTFRVQDPDDCSSVDPPPSIDVSTPGTPTPSPDVMCRSAMLLAAQSPQSPSSSQSKRGDVEEERPSAKVGRGSVTFALHNETGGTEMRRQQTSTSTASFRNTHTTHISNAFIELGSRLRHTFKRRKQGFMFTDYSSKEFARIRELAAIFNDDYLRSFKSTTMPSFSEGRSGAFLYFSSDRKYIVKTTSPKEFDKLLDILPAYVQYLSDELGLGRRPLINRFLGAHKIVMYDIPLYFVIMQNICPSVNEKYDLKGSWINRHSSKKRDFDPKSTRPKKFTHKHKHGHQDGAQLKMDNDLQNCFMLSPPVVKLLSEQVLRDIKLLQSFNLMDYSLLVGVKRQNFEIINDSPESRTADDTALQAALVEGQGTFYIGIIDVLQEWDYSKWWERMFKIFALRKDGKGISAVDPLTYRRRFYQRAVLDVFDGLDAEDADDDDVFEREPLILTASNIDALNSTHIHNGHRHDIEGGTINSTLSPLRTPDLVNGVRGSTSTHTTKTSLKACAGEDASQRSASVGDQEMPPLGPVRYLVRPV